MKMSFGLLVAKIATGGFLQPPMLVLWRATLLLVVCGGLIIKVFFFFCLVCDFGACCWVRTIILFEIFLKVGLFVLDKIGLLDLKKNLVSLLVIFVVGLIFLGLYILF